MSELGEYEEYSNKFNKLQELKLQRERAGASEDIEGMNKIQKQIDTLQKELGLEESPSEKKSDPEVSEVEARVVGIGEKDGKPSLRLGYGPHPWIRDHTLTVGDLSGLKQGEEPKSKEGDKTE